VTLGPPEAIAHCEPARVGSMSAQSSFCTQAVASARSPGGRLTAVASRVNGAIPLTGNESMVQDTHDPAGAVWLQLEPCGPHTRCTLTSAGRSTTTWIGFRG